MTDRLRNAQTRLKAELGRLDLRDTLREKDRLEYEVDVLENEVKHLEEEVKSQK